MHRYYGACRFERACADGKGVVQGSARKTVQLRQLCVLSVPQGPWEPAFFSEVRQQCLIKRYARKYSTFLQHLQVIMSLSLCVAMIDFNVLRFALENTQKRFEKQSDSSSSYTNCNVFL